MLDKLPPNDLYAEQVVIGAVLRNRSAIAEASAMLRAEDFYGAANADVWAALLDMDRRGVAIGAESLAIELNRIGKIDAIGGYATIGQYLQNSSPAGNEVELKHAAEQIRDKSMRRAVWNEVGQIARDAQDYPGTADEMLAAIQQRLFDISLRRTQLEVMPFHQVASLVADDIDRRSRSHRAAGMPTGFVDLDKLLGGMQAGETIVVGARTSVGKTSFAANIAYNVAANPVAAERVPVLFISHEQDAVEIGKKLICMHAEVSGIRVRAGKIESDEVDKLASAIRALSDIPLWINKTEVSNIEQIQSIAKAWKVKHNIGLLVIDYLQLTRTETSHRTIYETVTAVSRQAKQLARSLQIPVILPAQLNREVEAKANKEPTLATLRDSGGIEQDADIVLLLWQPDDATTGQTDRIIKVKIAKQRNGPLGTATLFFRGQTQRFENYEPQAPREWTR